MDRQGGIEEESGGENSLVLFCCVINDLISAAACEVDHHIQQLIILSLFDECNKSSHLILFFLRKHLTISHQDCVYLFIPY